MKRFKEEKQDINIQNFINEIFVLKPMFDNGRFLEEDGVNVSPDFLGEINGNEIVFECVSVNQAAESKKNKNKFLAENNKELEKWKKENPNGGVYSSTFVDTPFDTIELDELAEKIRTKKSSRQVKNYKYKVLVMSLNNMSFLVSSQDCLPCRSNNYGGVYSGFIFHAFYGRKNDFVFRENGFEGDRHKISKVKSDGKFIRKSEYNLCILHFDTKAEESYKKYVFFENVNNAMPLSIINTLCDIFEPYETHSILSKFIKSSERCKH